MSSIKSLKAFLDTWGPVVDAVPSVIEALNKKDFYDQQIALAKEDLDKLIASYNAEVDKQNEAVRVWQKELSALQAKVSEATQDVSNAQANARKVVMDCGKRAKAAEDQAAQRIEEARRSVEDEKIRLEGVLGGLRAEADARVKAMNDEIAETEKRVAAAQKKLEALRNQLG